MTTEPQGTESQATSVMHFIQTSQAGPDCLTNKTACPDHLENQMMMMMMMILMMMILMMMMMMMMMMMVVPAVVVIVKR